jgi:hypothetical protein
MVAHPALSTVRADTFLIGYCDDTQALLAHLAAEAPWRLTSLRVLDPDPSVVHALRGRGVAAEVVGLRDVVALRAAGLEDATTVVVFAERIGGPVGGLERVIRTASPAAQFLVVPAGAGASTRSRSAPPSPTLRVVRSWRLWALVGLVIVDGLTSAVPLTPLLLLALALVNPRWLHTAARFFDDLAEAR